MRAMFVIAFTIYIVARSAIAPSLIVMCVKKVIGVPLRTVCLCQHLQAKMTARFSSAVILAGGDCLKMFRIGTGTIATKVVYFKSIWNWAYKMLISPAVNTHLVGVSQKHIPISLCNACPHPFPTAIRLLLNVLPEPLFRRSLLHYRASIT